MDEEYYLDYCMRSYCSAIRLSADKAETAVCNAIAVYSSECAKNKVVVHWRSDQYCREFCFFFFLSKFLSMSLLYCCCKTLVTVVVVAVVVKLLLLLLLF